MMKNFLLLLAILPFIISCNGQEKTDLAKLNLNEPVENLISETSRKSIGKDNVEYPFAILVEDTDTTKFTFLNIPVNRVYFLLAAKVNNDSVFKSGGGHFEGTIFKTKEQLLNNLSELKKHNINNEIFGFRAEIRDPKGKSEIKKLLTKMYGNGTKNPNTDNGLYWNVKKENRYIFFAPDYDRLIVLNNKKLSKTCYWDIQNGMIDFRTGNCQVETYFKEMGVGDGK
jgi:hypothetical protein